MPTDTLVKVLHYAGEQRKKRKSNRHMHLFPVRRKLQVWLLFSRQRVGDGDYANAEVGYVLSHYNLSPFTIQNLHRLHEYMVIH